MLRDPDAIPLVGVPRASERAFATAHVLATEQAIERAVERGVENLGAARVTPEVAADAIGRQSAVLGSPLTPGQQAAVLGIATSGRGVELVEGVAGSGKTTVMAAVRDAFEQGGFTVIGTSTSGQAARTLGREAGIAKSRTLASLRWRIEHERMRLTQATSWSSTRRGWPRTGTSPSSSTRPAAAAPRWSWWVTTASWVRST